MKKYKFIDLFAGCGGLEDGFLQSGRYIDIAAVEWLKPQVNTLIRRLETKWKVEDAAERVMHFDIQRETELFAGWDDEKFGSGKGLDYFVNKAQGIDVIIGGPPCQAYSIAGRVRDENGMRDDYRNYLFEHYLSVVNRYRPKVFVFENVPGILSAAPDGTPITDLIKQGFANIGYDIIEDLKITKVNASDYGVPQNRDQTVNVEIISCHNSVTYEEIIGGITADTDSGKMFFEYKDKIFLETIIRAASDYNEGKGTKYVLIMDDLQRNDVSTLIGDAVNAIGLEGEEGKLCLNSGMVVEIPPNFYIIKLSIIIFIHQFKNSFFYYPDTFLCIFLNIITPEANYCPSHKQQFFVNFIVPLSISGDFFNPKFTVITLFQTRFKHFPIFTMKKLSITKYSNFILCQCDIRFSR